MGQEVGEEEMSSPTRDTAGKIATVWPRAFEDKYGRKTYGAPYTIRCTFDANDGTVYTDNKGVTFTPSFVVWSEFDGSYVKPAEGGFIMEGDFTSELDPVNVEDALPIKSVEISDCSLLGEPDDIRILA